MDNWFKQSPEEVKAYLDQKYLEYAKPEFIDDDPICIPHEFTINQDIEIAGYLAATIAWGRRDLIIRSARSIIRLMGNAPFDFVQNASSQDLSALANFRHRTFKGEDLKYIILAFRELYLQHESMEDMFISTEDRLNLGIEKFRTFMLSHNPEERFKKHIASPAAGSAAKRINMFLRWMVRKDSVDFGIWTKIKPSQLSCPLDVHSGNTARKLGLLERKQNDWKSVVALDQSLRSMDADDPVKYDLALFGIGRYENIISPS